MLLLDFRHIVNPISFGVTLLLHFRLIVYFISFGVSLLLYFRDNVAQPCTLLHVVQYLFPSSHHHLNVAPPPSLTLLVESRHLSQHNFLRVSRLGQTQHSRRKGGGRRQHGDPDPTEQGQGELEVTPRATSDRKLLRLLRLHVF